ncbi:hypothetical protein Pfo_020065 [Paulownia fortunei]|nr:hypothetical protein Pfo_020065 [Paulownia fortunei]
MLTSQGLFMVTALAVSAGTIILFDLFREKYSPSSQIPRNQDFPPDEKQVLKSCLSPGSRKREKEQKKKKKRVQFADDVKDSRGNTNKLYQKKHRKSAELQNTSCGNEVLGFQKMPPNRVALYSGILKDRVQRMEYSC